MSPYFKKKWGINLAKVLGGKNLFKWLASFIQKSIIVLQKGMTQSKNKSYLNLEKGKVYLKKNHAFHFFSHFGPNEHKTWLQTSASPQMGV